MKKKFFEKDMILGLSIMAPPAIGLSVFPELCRMDGIMPVLFLAYAAWGALFIFANIKKAADGPDQQPRSR